MAINRISSLAVHQNTLRDASKVMAELANLQDQISSGLKTSKFEGLHGQVELFTNLEAKMRKADLYVENNSQVISRLETTSVTLDQIHQVALDLSTLIGRRRSPGNDNSIFEQQLGAIRSQLAGQLNTTLEGRFLFGGTKTDVPPVNDEPFPPPSELGVPDDNYYQGSKEDLSIRAQDNFDITYSVRADASAFQKIFAGLHQALEGHANNSDAELVKGSDLVSEGIAEVIALQANVNANKVDLEQINVRHDALRLYWKGVTESISKTDVVEASTQVALDQAVLTATFQSFAQINALRLADYL